ncbi:hypothetical protein NHX12_001873 [Muraenolepis orangiensis]|uniref:Uncharacterized protein n=1 Tax=Muraenolepis orangiensis TaxID=630683 RepID=A0A9Q0IHN6_9TELE|nr:hypothetical protein NHX12_001873 [Muraenolepis orangiensis]
MVTFSEVSWEAETLDREMRSRDCRACHAVPPTVAAAAMVVDLEKWKETKRAELRQEMKEQMTALMETLVREVRQNGTSSEAPRPQRELFQGSSQGVTGFNSTLSGEARREWQKAFAAGESYRPINLRG